MGLCIHKFTAKPTIIALYSRRRVTDLEYDVLMWIDNEIYILFKDQKYILDFLHYHGINLKESGSKKAIDRTGSAYAVNIYPNPRHASIHTSRLSAKLVCLTSSCKLTTITIKIFTTFKQDQVHSGITSNTFWSEYWPYKL